MFEWAYSGVNFTLAGNGGPECINYLSRTWLITETVLVCLFSMLFEILFTWTKLSFNFNSNLEVRDRFGRKLLLTILCLIWGIEIGFKFATSQLIFLLNPCHMITMVQVRKKALLTWSECFLIFYSICKDNTSNSTSEKMGKIFVPCPSVSLQWRNAFISISSR